MKTLFRLNVALAVSLLLMGTCPVLAQLPSSDLEGTWEMVSQELVYPDSVVDQTDEWGPGYKILNSTHFAWGRETKNGEEVLAGGGRYEYDAEEDVYIEHIEYHSDPALVGIQIEFTARVEGDTWYHIGELQSYKLREVWQRVDPEDVRREMEGGSPASSDTEQ